MRHALAATCGWAATGIVTVGALAGALVVLASIATAFPFAFIARCVSDYQAKR